jgi:hypothetical protein
MDIFYMPESYMKMQPEQKIQSKTIPCITNPVELLKPTEYQASEKNIKNAQNTIAFHH